MNFSKPFLAYFLAKLRFAALKISFLLFVFTALCGCREQIIHNLSEQQVNRLIWGLEEISIEGRRVKQSDGKWALSTESKDSVKALKYLSDARLLPEETPAAAGKASVVSSREDQRFIHERALSHEIEKTLLAVPSVLDARVHINLPPVDPFFGQTLQGGRGSASVLMVVKPEWGRNGKEEIASVVAGASGVPAAEVSVIIKSMPSSADTKTGEQGSPVKPPPVQVEVKTEKIRAVSSAPETKPAARALSFKISRWHVLLICGVLCLCAGVIVLLTLWKRPARGDEFMEMKDVVIPDPGN